MGIDPDEFLRELDYQADLDPNGSLEDNKYQIRNDLPSEYKLAVELLYGAKPPFFLSEALKEFQTLRGEIENSRVFKDRTRAVSGFISLSGDRPIE
ncbi:MAG: hypothetical protein NXH97_09240 [Rhodobacteraceae bacterium]|nr:hypothetical protein [Paracoccaceae bacterium]